jgi:hypothetical protein
MVAIAVLGTAGWFISTAPARVLEARQRGWGVRFQEGDLIFQDLDCGTRCALIREVTESHYTHVGIVLRERETLKVWEAYEPVGPTDLVEWVRRGIGERVAIYRLRPGVSIAALAAAVRGFAGRPYDGDYQWDDERIYCSELIAKAVNQAQGTQMFEPTPIGSLGAHTETIRRMSHGRLTEQTLMVSPVALVRSPILVKLVDELERPRLTLTRSSRAPAK